MPDITLLLAALFLPLFPLSMVFNALFDRLQHVVLRCVMLIAWPQLGLTIIHASDTAIPSWLLSWALVTTILYAFRMLALRSVSQWNSFLATSMWAMLWLSTIDSTQEMQHLYAAGLSAPLVLLAVLSAGLEKRFGAAYTGLYGGLALSIPRFSGVLVFVVLAAIATPLFPGFIITLKTILSVNSNMPTASFILLISWLLWSWAGIRLLQGLIVGTADKGRAVDISLVTSWGYGIILIALVVSSLYLSGGLL